jgi:sugar lactone lactonase YvrE
MKISLQYFPLVFGLLLFFQNALAQAPNISYSPSSNSYQVGVAITNWVPTNTGGAINSSSSSTSVSGPSGMGINPANNDVYVTQYGGPTVTYYTSAMAYVGTLGSGYGNPDGVVFDASGNGYVVDPTNNAVYKITSAGVKSTLINTGLNSPFGIGIDAAGNLYVANTNANQIRKYSSAGALLLTITANVSTPVDVKVDASGNIYVLNQGTNNVTKYNSAGTYQSVFASGFNTPWALAIDASNNIYVGDSGNNLVDIYNSSGTLQSAKSVTDPEGLAVDAGGDLYVSSYSANAIIKFPANNGYTISPTALPAGLSFSSTTGTISGTPTAATAAVTYTVTGTNSSGSSTCTVTISTYNQYDWKGTTSTNWNTASNWSSGVVPGAADLARIGVSATYTLTRMPVIGAATSVGSIQMGQSGSLAPSISVNTGITLTVNGVISYQSDTHSGNAYTATLSGAGTISAQGVDVDAYFFTGTTYTQTMASSVTALNVSGNIGLNSTYNAGIAYNATLNITGGTVALSGGVQTSNGTSSSSTFTVANATLQLAGATALSGLSSSGTNIITFNGAGSTIQYSGTSAQTIYTSAAVTGLAGGVTYTNLSFSGSAIKTALSGNLTVTGSFTNSLTLNDATDYIDLSSPTVNFSGAAQTIAAGNGTGTTFYKVQFSGSGTKTISSGNAYVASSGVLTMSGGSATLAAGGLLTLNSDATGSATVAQIPTGNSITGNVNVQRYITGGSGYRTYRLISSPVYAATIGTYNVYSINYLQTGIYLTGNAGGGFDKTGNPTLFLYREDQTPSSATFTSGNYWGISAINNAPTYNYYLNGGATTYNIPAGDGMMFFFRGNRASASLATETLTSYTTPVTVTLSTAGTLNQGQVVVRDWYTPASANIGYTGIGTSGNYTVRGFNLVGNPYASSIDWSTFSSTVATAPIYGANVAPAIWTFDPGTKNFATYNAATGISTGNGGKIIASGQGFFVQATLASPSLTFQESAKTNSQVTNPKLLMDRRTDLSTLSQGAYNSYMRLKMITDSTNYSDVVIGFNPASSLKFNPAEDSRFIPGMGNIEAVAAISSDSIKAAAKWAPLPKNNANLVVKMHVSAAATGQYTLQRTDLLQIPALYQIWLMDRYKKDSLDIKNNATYIFDVDLSDTASFGDNRFQIVVRQDPALMVHLLNFTAIKSSGGPQLTWVTENEANYTNFTLQRSTDGGVTFTTLDGLTSSGQGTYSYLDKTPAMGANMYRLLITDLNGKISYSNVVTIMYGNALNSLVKTGIVVYPNPAKATLNLDIAAGFNSSGINSDLSSATYNVRITNILGSVIKQATISQPSWQTDVGALLPGTYLIQVVNQSSNSIVGQSTFIKL